MTTQIQTARRGHSAAAHAAPAADPRRRPDSGIGLINMRPAFRRNVNERSLSRAHGAALCGGVIGAVMGIVLAVIPGPLQAGSAYGAAGYAIVLGILAAVAAYAATNALFPLQEDEAGAEALRRRLDERIRRARAERAAGEPLHR